MDYKKMMGYGDEKKITKKQPKLKTNKILESVKEEFGYVNEGPAYEYRKPLKESGMLKRDSRKVERKKYGQPGARKKFQFSKR